MQFRSVLLMIKAMTSKLPVPPVADEPTQEPPRTPRLPHRPEFESIVSAMKQRRHVLLPVLLLVLVVVAVVGVYIWQHQQVANLSSSIDKERAIVADLGNQLTTLANLNNGVSTTDSQRSSTVSLVNGRVTFTMPTGWVLATASRFHQQCYKGAFDSKVMCLDTETIVPQALNVNNVTSTYGGINISVYRHDDTTSAADWFTNDFSSAGPYEQTGNQTENLTINGYNTFYVNTAKAKLEYGDQFNDEYYFLVNKSYVVRVDSNLNNNAGSNGTTIFNDNSQYSPVVKTFVNTIKMQGN